MNEPNSVDAILQELFELARQGRWQDVVDVAQRGAKAHPREPMLILRWAQGLRQLNKIENALQLSQRAIQIQPDLAEAHVCQADLLCIQGKWAKAAEEYQTAIRLWPGNAELYHRLGDTAMRAGQAPLAQAAFKQELALQPSARAWIDLGTIFETQNQWTAAQQCFQQAAQLEPANAAPWHRLGVCFGKQGDLERAIELIRHGLSIDARDGNIWHDLGIAYAKAGKPAEAAAACEQVVARQPKRLEDFYGWALNLRDAGQYEKALEVLDRALALDPEDADSRGLRGVIWLVQGHFEEGWPEYEWRKKTKSFTTPLQKFSTPEWRGKEDVAGKTIFLPAEQGMGDTIQFVRYVPLLAKRGAKVVVAVPDDLMRLVAQVEGVSSVISPGGVLPPFDLHCTLLSLPLAMGTREATIPAEIPYLRLLPEWVAPWRERLGEKPGKLRVGLAWAGSPAHRNDRSRSTRLETLRPMIEAGRAAGAEFYNLQKGEPTKNHVSGIGLMDWMNDVRDYVDTAALISQMDLVIAVDTSVVHVAGALGKPVWVLLPQVPDWRWMLERTDSPWYPTMRLFRQKQREDWAGPVGEAQAALLEMCKSAIAS